MHCGCMYALLVEIECGAGSLHGATSMCVVSDSIARMIYTGRKVRAIGCKFESVLTHQVVFVTAGCRWE